MKIPLVVEKSDRIILATVFRCPKKSILLPIRFVVDTGSPYSFLGRDDVVKQNRLLQNLPIKKQALMGGDSINALKVCGQFL